MTRRHDETTYTAIYAYDPDARAWSGIVEGVPHAHSWGRSLAQAQRHVREALAGALDVSDDEMGRLRVEHVLDLGHGPDEELRQLLRDRAALEEASDDVARRTRTQVCDLASAVGCLRSLLTECLQASSRRLERGSRLGW